MFTMRFDMRAPGIGAPAVELYEAAVSMVEWAETRGCLATILCEHHVAADGYLPAPVILASAMAARTKTMPINVSVVLLPLYDPVRLAEEMTVLDLISKGRVSYTAAIGYRPVEYALYGVDYHRRGKIADEKLDVLLRAKGGQPFEINGTTQQLTPSPLTPGGPMVAWGGGSIAAAKRAGRNGLGFFGQKGDPALGVAYEEAARAAGHEPGMCLLPDPESAMTTFVAEDLDEAWRELGPYLMHDVLSYAEWNEGSTDVASISGAKTAEELRAENRSHRILTVDEAIATVKSGVPLGLHPLIGGLPPETAWKYLKVVVDQVMPALS